MHRAFRPVSFVVLVTLVLVALGSVGPAPRAQAAPPPGVIPGQYIVTLRPGADPAAKANELARQHGLGVRHVYQFALTGFAATIPAARLARLQADPDVLTIEEDREVVATADTVPTGVRRVQAPENAHYTSGAVDVDVAILDTGIAKHGDLNVAGGKACVTGDSTTTDRHSHGTHVAGTVGARANGSGVVGVAPGARLWAVKVLSDGGGGSWSDVICGIDWVTANAATIEVANMSLSGGAAANDHNSCGTGLTSSLHNAICRSVNKGVTYVVAAGNSSVDANGSVPATYDEVITVSALADSNGFPCGGGANTSAGADDWFATFSNYGADVDIAGPGVDIYSTVPGGYGYKSGTSMASPHVAGSAALYVAANGRVGPAAVRSGLIAQWRIGKISGDPDAYPEGIVNVRWESATQGPVVSIKAPDTGQTVSGASVPFRFTAVDKTTGCRLAGSTTAKATLLDGQGEPTATSVSLPFSYGIRNGAESFEGTWDTSRLADGQWEITVESTDHQGNLGTAAPVRVSTKNGNTPLTVAFAKPDPATARYATGTVDLSATATSGSTSGDGTVDSVAFAYATAPTGSSSVWTTISTDTTAADGFTGRWDTAAKDGAGAPQVADGAYELRATAADGSETAETILKLTVDNTAPVAEIVSPAPSTVLTGSATVAVEPTETGSGVAQVVFESAAVPTDGNTTRAWSTIGEPVTAPVAGTDPARYAATWDTSAVPNGGYELRAITTDKAGNRFESTVVAVSVDNGAADTQAPTIPQGLETEILSGGVSLTWQAVTDTPASVITYDVYRGGAFLGSTTNVTYADGSVGANGFNVTYTVKARDAAGNVSGDSNAAVAFSDSFSSGGMGLWANSGLTVQTKQVLSAPYAAQAKTKGPARFAQAALGAGQQEVYVRVRFKVVSQSAGEVSLLKVLNANGGVLATVSVTNAGQVKLNGSPAAQGAGTAWHEIVVGLSTTAGAQFWYDGVAVQTSSGVVAGSVGRIQIGEDGRVGAYDLVFDDIAVATAPIGAAQPGAAAANEVEAAPEPTKAPNAKPVARAGVDQTLTDMNLDGVEIVTLDGSASTDAEGPIAAYEWSLGDAPIASGITATVALPVGQHTVTLRVTDGEGATDRSRVAVEVLPGNQPPVASAGDGVTAVDTGADGVESVTLDGTQSVDPEGGSLAYQWSVGGQVIAVEAAPAIVFPVGIHTVVLTVTDAAGATASDEVTVTVEAAPVAQATPPAAPSDLAAGQDGAAVVLAWTDNAVDETAYRIYRTTDGGATWTVVAELGPDAAAWQDVDVAPGTTYAYTVTAVGVAGESAPVAPVQVTVA